MKKLTGARSKASNRRRERILQMLTGKEDGMTPVEIASELSQRAMDQTNSVQVGLLCRVLISRGLVVRECGYNNDGYWSRYYHVETVDPPSTDEDA